MKATTKHVQSARSGHTMRSRPSVKRHQSTLVRSPSPPAMLKPGAVELPQPDSIVPLVPVEHSMQVDARRKFAATYEDITQYMDKCEYLFDHDEFYEKSYKSLAKTVTELNKIGTDAQQQEREQLYQSLMDWLSASSFTVDPPTHGIINEHQLIESSQITRDVLVKMLLGLERLRALHITIVDKLGSEAAQRQQPTDKGENKRQLLRMVGDSTFVWKTAAAEIVQLLHDERSKGGELVELYADKIRYLMGELEAQSNMIEELRAQLEQQPVTPLRIQDLDTTHDMMKTKRGKQDAGSKQVKQGAGAGQLQLTGDDDEEEGRLAVTGVPTLPDFNKQLIVTLQQQLEDCRRQNANLVARGHEAAAKIRFLTEENNRKEKQIGQLQANMTKLKSGSRDAEYESGQSDVGGRQQGGHVSTATTGKETEAERRTDRTASTKLTGKSQPQTAGRRVSSRDTTELSADVHDTDEDATTASRPMNLSQLIAAAAKRQKSDPQPQADATKLQPTQLLPATAAAATTARKPEASSTQPTTATSTKSTKPTRGLRTKGKVVVADRVPDTAAESVIATGKEPQPVAFQELSSSFWQQTSVKSWTQDDVSVDQVQPTSESKDTSGRSAEPAGQQTPVDMNEAIEMTNLYLAGSRTQQQPSVKRARRTSTQQRQQQQQHKPPSAAVAHVAPINAQFMAASSPAKEPVTPALHQQLLQRADKASSGQAAMTSSQRLAAATADSKSVDVHRAKTPAEAAKLRAARLSAALFHSGDDKLTSKPSPAVISPFGSAISVKSTQPQQKSEQAMPTKSKPRAKTGYDLVGVNMQNLAQQAKLLDNSAGAGGMAPITLQRFSQLR